MTNTMREPSDARVALIELDDLCELHAKRPRVLSRAAMLGNWAQKHEATIRAVLAAADTVRPPQAVQGGEAVAEFLGRRRTPEGTAEFWGVMLCDFMEDPPKGAKLYTHPAPAPAAVPAGYALVDKRDLFDVVRSAYFNGANNDGADEAALHSDAHDYALRCKLLSAMLAASTPPSTERGCNKVAQEPYALVTVRVGERVVQQAVTEEAMRFEREAGMALAHASQHCIHELIAATNENGALNEHE